MLHAYHARSPHMLLEPRRRLYDYAASRPMLQARARSGACARSLYRAKGSPRAKNRGNKHRHGAPMSKWLLASATALVAIAASIGLGVYVARNLVVSGAVLSVPTPSPTLSPLFSPQINHFTARATRASGLNVALVRAPNPCVQRHILCGPIHLWPRARSTRAVVVGQGLEVALTVLADSRLRPLRVRYGLGGVPTNIVTTFGLKAQGPAVGVAGAPDVLHGALGIITTDLVDNVLAQLLHVPRRAQRAENWARAIAALDAGLVRVTRAGRAEAALRASRDACQSAVTPGYVYSPAQGVGEYIPGGGVIDSGASMAPGCAYQFALPEGSPWLSIAPISVTPYQSLDPIVAANGLGVDAASKALPTTIRIGRWMWHHTLPRNPAERRAWLTEAGLAVVDGLVTSSGTAHGRPEADPLVRPFIHGGFTTIIASWLGSNALAAALTRRWSSAQRQSLFTWSSEQHALGILSWDRHAWPLYLYPEVINGMPLPSAPYEPPAMRVLHFIKKKGNP